MPHIVWGSGDETGNTAAGLDREIGQLGRQDIGHDNGAGCGIAEIGEIKRESDARAGLHLDGGHGLGDRDVHTGDSEHALCRCARTTGCLADAMAKGGPEQHGKQTGDPEDGGGATGWGIAAS